MPLPKLCPTSTGVLVGCLPLLRPSPRPLTDTESEIEEDTDYLEAWEAQPKPRTYDERREKHEKAAAKHHAAKMRSAENREGRALNNNAGTDSQRTYGVGGLSTRSVQAKKKKLRDEFKVGTLHISEAELKRSSLCRYLCSQTAFAAAASGQRTIAGISSSSDSERSSDPLIEEPKSSSDELAADEEEEPVPEQLEEQAREEHGNEVVDSIVLTDNIAEWVDTILDDAAPLDPKELSSLATASLKTARKAKDYRSEVLFASLADFCRWMPRMGRLRAALRVSRYHGRGAAFQH
ncbi:hypothetical protein B0H10DRAFT_2270389, partial [Mycena sp. CBHHK59/15]